MTKAIENQTGVIFDIKKYAIHDGPGIRTTVFFKGCPMRCSWCHNPESWSPEPEPMFRAVRCIRCGQCVEICPEDAITFSNELPHTDSARCTRCGTCIPACPSQARAIAGREVTVDEVIMEIAKDTVFYDASGGGVTFSGGEPLMQPDFLTALLGECRLRGIHTAIDTCCYAEGAIMEKIAPLADLFLCDIKHVDPGKHKQFTGVENGQILENISFLTKSGRPVIIRIPVVPGFNDTVEEITAVVEFVKSLEAIQQIDLLPYNSAGVSKARRLGRNGEMLQSQRPDETLMQTLATDIRRQGFNVHIGG